MAHIDQGGLLTVQEDYANVGVMLSPLIAGVQNNRPWTSPKLWNS